MGPESTQDGQPWPRSDGPQPRRLLVIASNLKVTPQLRALIEEQVGPGNVDLFIVAPALALSALDHLTSEIDDSAKESGEELQRALRLLETDGWTVRGEVGDADPLLAIEDGLGQFRADEIMAITPPEDEEVWAERKLFEQIDERFGLPAVHVVARGEEAEMTEHASARAKGDDETEVASGPYGLPAMSARDLAATAVGIVGTIVLLILIASAPGGIESSTGKLRALLAVYAGLLTVYNIFRLILFESVRFRRVPSQVLSWLSLVGVPIAVLVGLFV